MNNKFSLDKKTLFVGGHPDDISISAGITILENPSNVFVVTLTDGASLFEVDYPVKGDDGSIYYTADAYSKQRLEEDDKAISSLGVKQNINLKFSDQDSYKSISEIIEKLDALVTEWGIEQIVTHEFPQTHPDHEVSWFASHMVAKKYNITVWEFPTYKYDENNVCITEFSDVNSYSNIFKKALTLQELSIKEDLLKIYTSQEGIVKNHLVKVEEFAQREFSKTLFSQTISYLNPWIREAKPEDIRKNFIELMGDKFE